MLIFFAHLVDGFTFVVLFLCLNVVHNAQHMYLSGGEYSEDKVQKKPGKFDDD